MYSTPERNLTVNENHRNVVPCRGRMEMIICSSKDKKIINNYKQRSTAVTR